MNKNDSPVFADGALLWNSFASRILGWRPGEFWAATPSELVAALRDPETLGAGAPPSRELISQLLERDQNG